MYRKFDSIRLARADKRSAHAACITLVVLGILLSACGATTPPRVAECHLQPPDSLERLAAHSREQLSPTACRGRFSEYLELSLTTAELAPDPANRARFAEMLNDSAQHGLVSEHEARLAFNRYFHSTFISLPAEYNLCSVLRREDELIRSLERELEDKRRGMLVISSDPQLFADTQRQYADLTLILHAVALACGDR